MSKRIFAMVSTKASKDYTPTAIESFLSNTELLPDEKLVIIDNDKSLDQSIQNQKISVIEPLKPRSFAENFNWVFSEAKKNSADIYFLNNDLIFTPDWLPPLSQVTDSIVTPVSNREYQYRKDGLRLDISCKLDHYLQNKEQLNGIARHHRKKFFTPTFTSRRKVFSLPFFCVKIPVAIWQALGPLDETYGKGGAEDNDYCLRAHLAGLKVEYALESYLLHFSGKSTWDGAENAYETSQRDELYRSKFKDKWGEQLLKLSIFGDISPLYSSPELVSLFQQGNFGEVVTKLKPRN